MEPKVSLPLPALVFCRSRKRVEGIARELAGTLGWDRVGAYHAGLTKEERAAIEEWFFHADDAVLVATCAYGMGVDKSNIRSVIHYDVPASVEAFLQESGRAGRDGESALSIVLHNAADAHEAEHAGDREREARFRQLIEYCTTDRCRREFLLGALGAECEACFGCDRCRPHEYAHDTLVRTLETATARFWRYIWANRRALTLDQAVRLSGGRPERGDRWIPRRAAGPGSTVLPGWTEPEISQLAGHLCRLGLIHVTKRGPWKGRLTARLAGDKHAGAPGHGSPAR